MCAQDRPIRGLLGMDSWLLHLGLVWCSELAASCLGGQSIFFFLKIRRADFIISLFFRILIKISGGALQMLLTWSRRLLRSELYKLRGELEKATAMAQIERPSCSSSSLPPPPDSVNEKPVIVRVKRKLSQARFDGFCKLSFSIFL